MKKLIYILIILLSLANLPVYAGLQSGTITSTGTITAATFVGEGATFTGNVGIGTASPSFKLDISNGMARDYSPSSDAGFVFSKGTGKAGMLAAGNSGTGFNFDDSGKFAIGKSSRANIDAGTYSGTDLMTILASGYVGIGTTSPTKTLHVNGDIRIDGGNRILDFGDDSRILKYDVANGNMSMQSPGNVSVILDNNNNGSTDFFSVRKGTTSVTDSTELMRVNLNGNVGIGTASPRTKLEVNGSIVFKDWDQGTADSYGIGTYVSGGVNNSNLIAGMEIQPVTADEAYPYKSQRIHFITHHAYAGTWGRKMTIDEDGKVGIGTASPSEKLEVSNGNIKTSYGIIAATATFSDLIIANGTYSSGSALSVSGAGTRMFWYPKKAAFRAGYVSGTNWDDANIGAYSFSAGYNNKASGRGSVALGYSSTASQESSIALGGFSTASGQYATATGLATTAQSFASLVLGQYNIISGTTDSWVETDPLFVIGNGSDFSHTSNAMTVLKNGNVGIGTTTPTEKLEVNGNIKITNQAAGGVVPAGAVFYFAMATVPAGYLECNGAAVSRTTYATLFTAISTTFGTGDGSTTFNLPDLRGEFIRGYDNNKGTDTGRVFGSAQTDAFQGHRFLTGTKRIFDAIDGYYGTVSDVGTGGYLVARHTASIYNFDLDYTSLPLTDNTNGTPRTSTETRPKNVALLPCIKY